jgi:hypothetical protein
MVFRFLPHFPFLFGESDPESLYAQRIPDTLDFLIPTTEATSLTVIDVFIKNNNSGPLLQSNVHFHTHKNKNYPKVQKQHALAKNTSCQLMKQQPFPVRNGLQTGSY